MPFSPKSFGFLRALKRNNKREWFHANREQYEAVLREPSLEFLEQLKSPLLKVFPTLDVSRKCMFRIHRDTRFSADKSPYKTHVGFLFRDRLIRSGIGPSLYFGFDPTGFAFGCGVYDFEKGQREKFREWVMATDTGARFRRVIAKVAKDGFAPHGKELKRIPPGYDADHPNAEFLLYNGCYLSKELDPDSAFYRDEFPVYVAKLLSKTQPFFEWMREMTRACPADVGRFLNS